MRGQFRIARARHVAHVLVQARLREALRLRERPEERADAVRHVARIAPVLGAAQRECGLLPIHERKGPHGSEGLRERVVAIGDHDPTSGPQFLRAHACAPNRSKRVAQDHDARKGLRLERQAHLDAIALPFGRQFAGPCRRAHGLKHVDEQRADRADHALGVAAQRLPGRAAKERREHETVRNARLGIRHQARGQFGGEYRHVRRPYGIRLVAERQIAFLAQAVARQFPTFPRNARARHRLEAGLVHPHERM